MTAKVDPVKRKQWRHDVARFKQGMKIRARMGILDSYRAEVYKARMSSSAHRPDWKDAYWQRLLCDCITCHSFPEEILRGFVETAEFTYLRVEEPSVNEILAAVDWVIEEQNIPLRTLYGVFV